MGKSLVSTPPPTCFCLHAAGRLLCSNIGADSLRHSVGTHYVVASSWLERYDPLAALLDQGEGIQHYLYASGNHVKVVLHLLA
jgi:hypothetical protein